eukprot:scaffold99631_cov66-Phaeocystis_antarctica.AAC.1
MLQKRNQVFESVFCADVQRRHALQLLPLPPPSKRCDGIWKVCFHAASFARGAHRARRHVHAHAHVGSPWSADEHVWLDMLCGIPFVFGILLRAQSTPSSRCPAPASLLSRAVQSSEFRVYSSLCSRGPLSRATLPLLEVRAL